jgi:ketosteroid isomerase-like protein
VAGEGNRAVVERYAAAMNSQDMEALDTLLHDEVVEVYPQSGERFTGRANLRAMLEHYPDAEGTPEPSNVRLATRDDRWVVTPAFTVFPAIGGG